MERMFQKTISTHPDFWKWLCALVLIVIHFWIYADIRNQDFVTWDDTLLIHENPLVTQIEPTTFWDMFQNSIMPLRDLSYRLDYLAWGLTPEGYKISNLFFSTLNILVLFLFLLHVSRGLWRAFGISLIFLLHPVNSEVVCWISSRKDLLAFLFFYLSFIFYIRSIQRQQIRYVAYFMSIIFACCAYLSKGSTVGLGFILLAYWVVKKRDVGVKKAIILILPFWLLVLPVVAQTYLLGSENEVFNSDGTLAQTYMTMQTVPWKYLVSYFYPVALTSRYEIPLVRSPFDVQFILGSIGNIFIVCATIYFLGKRKIFAFWMVLIIFLFLPYANFFPTSILMADRYSYLWLPGFIILGLGAVEKLIGLLPKPLAAKYKYWILATIVVSITPVLLLQTHIRRDVWHNSFTLWNDVIAKYPRNAVAYTALGHAYALTGRPHIAENSFIKSISLDRKYFQAYHNLGALYFETKDYRNADLFLRAAQKILPEYPKTIELLREIHTLKGSSSTDMRK
jgi:hypothetical protein